MAKYYILFILIFSLLRVSAQNVEFTKSYFPNKQKELNEAIKEIKKGDKLTSGKKIDYYNALKHYLKADSFNPSNALLNYKIGVCYYKTTFQKSKAVKYLEKSYKLSPHVKPDVLLWLGQAYQSNYEFPKAISTYLAYKLTYKANFSDKPVDKKIDECNLAILMVKQPVDVIISDLDNNVNSIYADYSPVINGNESLMLLTSRRENSTGGKISPRDNKYYEDIYLCTFDKSSNSWKKAINPGEPLNSRLHDASSGLSRDGKKLLVYKTKKRGDIFESFADSTGKFSRPKRLPWPINTSSHESSACYSPDGNTIYFSSNREEGSYGGYDIFMSRKNAKGKWGPAINLGDIINTEYDEKGVFIASDGRTLYFSSTGHKTMGGFDFFKSNYDNGKWSSPVNIGYPINTPDDDIHFSMSDDGKNGYIASERAGGLGDLDIYKISFLKADKNVINNFEPLIASTFKHNLNFPEENLQVGYVYDDISMRPVKAKILIRKTKNKNIADSLISDPVTGIFSSKLPEGEEYELIAMADNYQRYTEIIGKKSKLNKTIYMKPVKVLNEGFIMDMENNTIVCNARITIKNKTNTSDKQTLYSDCKTGKYICDFTGNGIYEITVNAKGYLPYTENDSEVANKVIYLLRDKK